MIPKAHGNTLILKRNPTQSGVGKRKCGSREPWEKKAVFQNIGRKTHEGDCLFGKNHPIPPSGENTPFASIYPNLQQFTRAEDESMGNFGKFSCCVRKIARTRRFPNLLNSENNLGRLGILLQLRNPRKPQELGIVRPSPAR